MRFFDDNTRSWWTPITGGSNVPALNDLLAPHGIALGDTILTGTVKVAQHSVQVGSPAVRCLLLCASRCSCCRELQVRSMVCPDTAPSLPRRSLSPR